MESNTSGQFIYADALQLIGNTPMVRLNRVGKELDCELVAKLEFYNPGGSIKDRIGRQMVDDAMKQGRIQPGKHVLVEPTSGNTGIGVALASCVRGFRCILTLPKKMSAEKVAILEGFGAEVIRTPTEAAWDAPESHIGVSNKLCSDNPDTHVCLDQYKNPSNPVAHEIHTASEILRQTGKKIDMLIIGVGTGGTITGIAKAIKKELPQCVIVGVDPHGSILHDPDHAKVHTYEVEGIGYDFVPKVLDRNLVDEWQVTHDAEAFQAARRIIREEGLLVGGSSGSALVAALRAAKRLKKGQRCVVIFPDSIRNYLTKFLNDDWMRERGYLEGPSRKSCAYCTPAAKQCFMMGGIVGAVVGATAALFWLNRK